jgi:hypothetical protein
MLKRTLPLLLILPFLIAGCSKKPSKIGTLSSDNNGLHIELTSLPDPPQAGSDTFTIKVSESASGAAVVNANVTVSAFNKLANGGDRETGRSQGDGTYSVPINLGIADKYTLDVQVQRPGHDDSYTQFKVDAE